jgi:hypothetical protein
VGGVSGAAFDVLQANRGKAENQIVSQAYQSAQTPLLAAYQQASEAAKSQALDPWKAQIEELQYPYQILPGIVSGTLPPQVVEQSGGDSGGCFLTTACVEAAWLPDDCEQLQVLRRFRDTFMRFIPGGREMLATYYTEAPKIVRSIATSQYPEVEYHRMFAEIKDAVNKILRGDSDGALDAYRAMFLRLSNAYLI